MIPVAHLFEQEDGLKTFKVISSGQGVIFYGYPNSGPDESFIISIPIKMNIIYDYNTPLKVKSDKDITNGKSRIITFWGNGSHDKKVNGWNVELTPKEITNTREINDFLFDRMASKELRLKVNTTLETTVVYNSVTKQIAFNQFNLKLSNNPVLKNSVTIVSRKVNYNLGKDLAFFINKSFFKKSPDELAHSKGYEGAIDNIKKW